MSLTPDEGKVELNKLINSNKIKYLNNFITLPNDSHRYRYNPNKELSKILFKNFQSYYIKDMSQRLDRKTTIPKQLTSSLEAGLKHDYDVYFDRYWVNRDKFWEFRDEYDELQEREENPVNVELHIIAEIKEVYQNNEIKFKDAFLPQKTVFGGMEGVKLYLKKVVINSVYAWEESAAEIQHIFLNKLYIQKARKNLSTDIRNIKMYGGIFNYSGYGLEVQHGKIPNACVPQYIYKLYNNEEETNPRKRLKKLTLDKIVEELGMISITDGCDTEQIKRFCEKHKITYYALNYKYKTFDTNNHMNYNSNLPRLVFMCAENHLYPIEDEDARVSLFKTYSNVGGKIKKYKTQQHFENDKLKINSKTKTFLHLEDMNFYALYEHVMSQKEYDTTNSIFRIILTVPGSCHNTFYTELQKKTIHNGKVRISTNN